MLEGARCSPSSLPEGWSYQSPECPSCTCPILRRSRFGPVSMLGIPAPALQQTCERLEREPSPSLAESRLAHSVSPACHAARWALHLHVKIDSATRQSSPTPAQLVRGRDSGGDSCDAYQVVEWSATGPAGLQKRLGRATAAHAAATVVDILPQDGTCHGAGNLGLGPASAPGG